MAGRLECSKRSASSLPKHTHTRAHTPQQQWCKKELSESLAVQFMENEERCAGWNGMRCSSSGMEVVKNCSFLFVCASPPSKHHTEKVDQGWIGYCTKVTDLGKQASGFCQRMEDLMVWLLPKFWIYRLKPAIKRPPKRWKWHQTSPHTYGGGRWV